MTKRWELANRFQGETLVRKSLKYGSEYEIQVKIAPDLNVVKIGGHGTIDFGSEVVLPLLEEVAELAKTHQILVVVGGGVRVRHVMDVGVDLGMPTGILADLSAEISKQNSIMVATLLSEYGGVRIEADDLMNIPMLIKMGMIPVMAGTPPYGLYEEPSKGSMIPQHRTDTGAYLAAEVLGARSCILVKNVEGLFAENPFINPDAEFIPDIAASDLLDLNMDDMVLERKVVELLPHSKSLQKINIINGHVPGTLSKALAGETVGTVIRAE